MMYIIIQSKNHYILKNKNKYNVLSNNSKIKFPSELNNDFLFQRLFLFAVSILLSFAINICRKNMLVIVKYIPQILQIL